MHYKWPSATNNPPTHYKNRELLRPLRGHNNPSILTGRESTMMRLKPHYNTITCYKNKHLYGPFGPLQPLPLRVGKSGTTAANAAITQLPPIRHKRYKGRLRRPLHLSSHIGRGSIIAAFGRNSALTSYVNNIKTFDKTFIS